MVIRYSLAAAAAVALFATTAQATRPEVIHRTIAEVTAERGPKILTIDPANKATTAVYTIRGNWVGSGRAHYHTGYEEIYILEGDVTLDGGKDYYVKGSYLYRPGGIVHGHQEGSKSGTRMITRSGTSMDFNYVDKPTSQQEYVAVPNPTDGRPHIVHLKTATAKAETMGSGEGRYTRKTLSKDANTGATTSLLEFPTAFKGRIELPAKMNREWVVIGGEAATDDGTVYGLESFSFRPAGAARAFVSAAPNTQILLWEEP